MFGFFSHQYNVTAIAAAVGAHSQRMDRKITRTVRAIQGYNIVLQQCVYDITMTPCTCLPICWLSGCGEIIRGKLVGVCESLNKITGNKAFVQTYTQSISKNQRSSSSAKMLFSMATQLGRKNLFYKISLKYYQHQMLNSCGTNINVL